jgi:Tol biopolymer transport system component
MDDDGYHARPITDDDYTNADPTWSPDGRYIVYSSYRGDPAALVRGLHDPRTRAAANAWSLVRVDVATGKSKILTSGRAAFRPVYDPDGSRIYFIGLSGPPFQSDVWVVDAAGGEGRPLQVTTRIFETSVDIQ